MNELSARREYTRGELPDVPSDPIQRFSSWLQEAAQSGIRDPNAMTLATVDADGRPSVRTVLLKQADDSGFAFFTNYGSRKARSMENAPHVALAFFWADLERQVLVEGEACKTSDRVSDDYFRTRPRGAQLSVWASRQSAAVASREELEKKRALLKAQYEGKPIPRPPFWGGYRVSPLSIEFWQGRADRLNDRLRYTRTDNGWRMERLQP